MWGRGGEVAVSQRFNEIRVPEIEHSNMSICLKIRRLCAKARNYIFSQRIGEPVSSPFARDLEGQIRGNKQGHPDG